MESSQIISKQTTKVVPFRGPIYFLDNMGSLPGRTLMGSPMEFPFRVSLPRGTIWGVRTKFSLPRGPFNMVSLRGPLPGVIDSKF